MTPTSPEPSDPPVLLGGRPLGFWPETGVVKTTKTPDGISIVCESSGLTEHWLLPAGRPAEAVETMPVAPECLRWRREVSEYLHKLDPSEPPALATLASALCVQPDSARARASRHKDCCGSWRDIKSRRSI